MTPLVDALVTVGIAGTAAASVLLAKDPLVRQVVRRALHRDGSGQAADASVPSR
jgi:hypothetical protein